MSRILVIDGERHIREWYALELSEFGHEVNTTGSQFEILDKIEVLKPDLIILDIKSPDCYGLGLLQKIHNYYPDLSVIICSSYSGPCNNIEKFASDYNVIKSSDLTHLKETVERIFEANTSLLTMAV